jgi:organic hydroperoxide reductase OsmC/OhrA
VSHGARVIWERGDAVFTDNRYSRKHRIEFDGGAVIPGSSSPTVVRAPYSDPAAIDPEEQFIASISSCHMLWFLSIAAKHKFRVDRYEDDAEGVMEKNAEGKVAITKVTLRPRVAFSGDKVPSAGEIDHLHHEAHEECFIASSVKTEIRVEPVS